jgi:PhnB protein
VLPLPARRRCGAPSADGRPATALHLHVDDADAVIAAAVAAGAALIRPATDMFCGERSGVIRDPFGHEWMVGHEIERVEADEMQRRWNAVRP